MKVLLKLLLFSACLKERNLRCASDAPLTMEMRRAGHDANQLILIE